MKVPLNTLIENSLLLMFNEVLAWLILIPPSIFLFWLLPVWFIPILFPLIALVGGMMWMGKRGMLDIANGLQILAFIVFSVLVLLGVSVDIYDILKMEDTNPITIQYEEDLKEARPLSLLYFDNWEVDMSDFTKYSRREYSESSNSYRYITSYTTTLRRKRSRKEEAYVVVVEGNLPLDASAKEYWQQPNMNYGFIPNKMNKLTDYSECIEHMKEQGVSIHPDAIFVELFDGPEGKRLQVWKWLKTKLAVGGIIWLLIHLGSFIYAWRQQAKGIVKDN